MTEEQQTAPETRNADDNAGDLRRKLVTRLAVAGVLVALLLGVLAFFDYLARAPEDDEEVAFSHPVPVAPKKEMSQPVKPAENLPEPPAAEPAAAATPAEPPPPPVVEAKPAVPAEARPDSRAETATARTEASQARPEAPSEIRQNSRFPVTNGKTATAPAAEPKSVPEATSAPSNRVPPREAAPAEPVAPTPARVVESRPAPGVTPPAAPRLFSGFLLQAGVFSSIQRAEELHAKLTLSGVPSSVETRVQVGPFKTRQEAEAAQVKLRALGIETMLVPPKGKN